MGKIFTLDELLARRQQFDPARIDPSSSFYISSLLELIADTNLALLDRMDESNMVEALGGVTYTPIILTPTVGTTSVSVYEAGEDEFSQIFVANVTGGAGSLTVRYVNDSFSIAILANDGENLPILKPREKLQLVMSAGTSAAIIVIQRYVSKDHGASLLLAQQADRFGSGAVLAGPPIPP